MSLMTADDPAVVLEDFTQNIGNVPAELCHILEELEEKEKDIQKLLQKIEKENHRVQRFIKMNGSMMVDPQAEPNGKEIRRLYDDVERLQNEKCSLADRSTRLVSHTKNMHFFHVLTSYLVRSRGQET